MITATMALLLENGDVLTRADANGNTIGVSCDCCCEQGEGRELNIKKYQPNDVPSAGTGAALAGRLGMGWGLVCDRQGRSNPTTMARQAPEPGTSAPLPSWWVVELLGAMPTKGYINVKAFYISLFYLHITYI